MRPAPKSLARLGLPAVVVLGLTLALGGCSDPATPAPSAPAAAAPPSTTPPRTTPASTSPSSTIPGSKIPVSKIPVSKIPATTGTTGSDGLTVRYLGDDGTVKTVGVEDFPR